MTVDKCGGEKIDYARRHYFHTFLYQPVGYAQIAKTVLVYINFTHQTYYRHLFGSIRYGGKISCRLLN